MIGARHQPSQPVEVAHDQIGPLVRREPPRKTDRQRARVECRARLLYRQVRRIEALGLIQYQPESGDPLGLGGYVELDDRDLLSRTRETDMPDAPRQLLQLFQTSRAGDLVLAAAPGADFRGPWEVPEHRAGHGSLIAEHMEVPIAASVALPDSPIRTVDLMPTILERLDLTVPPGVVLDGVPFSKIAAATEPLVR